MSALAVLSLAVTVFLANGDASDLRSSSHEVPASATTATKTGVEANRKKVKRHTRGVQVIDADASSPDSRSSAPPPPAPVTTLIPSATDSVQTTANPTPKSVAPVRPTEVPTAHSVIKVCDPPNAKWDLTYGEQGDFDRALGQALKEGRRVVISLAMPYSDKEAPPQPLDAWISAAKSGGGAVAVSPYCASSRGIGGSWFSGFIDRLTGAMYRPARNYDVTLFADSSRHKITQIEFSPKATIAPK